MSSLSTVAMVVYDAEPINDGWPGTSVIHLDRSSPGAVRVVDEALPATLAHEVYEYTVGVGRSWGDYVTLQEAMEASDVARGDEGERTRLHLLAMALVHSVWLNGSDASELLTPELHRVHGFALWANISGLGDECDYHLDYAELHRRRTLRLHAPLLASTIHVSELEAGEMEGGVFGVNTGGLQHYLRFGHHCNLMRSPDALERDWDADANWVKVNYRFRRAILFDGMLPHRATPIETLAEDSRRRVVVGINVFDTSVGPQVAAAPIHSEAYYQARDLHEGARVGRNRATLVSAALVPRPSTADDLRTRLNGRRWPGC